MLFPPLQNLVVVRIVLLLTSKTSFLFSRLAFSFVLFAEMSAAFAVQFKSVLSNPGIGEFANDLVLLSAVFRTRVDLRSVLDRFKNPLFAELSSFFLAGNSLLLPVHVYLLLSLVTFGIAPAN